MWSTAGVRGIRPEGSPWRLGIGGGSGTDASVTDMDTGMRERVAGAGHRRDPASPAFPTHDDSRREVGRHVPRAQKGLTENATGWSPRDHQTRGRKVPGAR